MRIDIDDICLENLLDIIEGKKVVTDEIRQNVVNQLRHKIIGCRKWYKENTLKKGITQRTVLSIRNTEPIEGLDIDEE